MKRVMSVVAVLILVAGCKSDPDAGKLVTVTGTVTWEGSPLSNAVVTFHPTGTTLGQGGFAKTGPDGKYQLQTPRGGKGALPGDYVVTVSKLVDPKTGADAVLDPTKPPIEQPEVRELLPPQFSNQQLSTLKRTVPPGGGTLDLSLAMK